ncbi:IQ domain-containing protein H isoform X5 [Hydra vulgaris]|uniref:IQ domain-containing protein H isoform X5 n=1 Tax=Hydra vulgaris TaxID=6087 RepID=A0ABM4DE36_HYDVU
MSKLGDIRLPEEKVVFFKKLTKSQLKPLPEIEGNTPENNVIKLLEEIQNDIKELKDNVLQKLENADFYKIKDNFEVAERLWQVKKQEIITQMGNLCVSSTLRSTSFNHELHDLSRNYFIKKQSEEKDGKYLNYQSPEAITKHNAFNKLSINSQIKDATSVRSLGLKTNNFSSKTKYLKMTHKNYSESTKPLPRILFNDQSLNNILNLPLYNGSRKIFWRKKVKSRIKKFSSYDGLHESSQTFQSTTFIIKDGIVCESQEYIYFKQYHYSSLDCVMPVLQKIERLLHNYSVPLAVIDGNKLVDIGLNYEREPTLTDEVLLSCIVNRKDIEEIIKIPGQRFLAKDGHICAAVKIQATWRCHMARASYLILRKRKWAASMIALSWVMKCKLTMVRQLLKNNQMYYLSTFRKRAKDFQALWATIKKTRHTVIHIPSLGYNVNLRRSIDNIATMQNQQIGRFCDVKDPNVEVIYVSPVEISKECCEYYDTLTLSMCQATEQDYNEVKQRLLFITPDLLERFKAHNLCLSSLLKYSMKTLKRIQLLVKGKQAYIVPGLMHADDLFIAHYLDLPVLGCEPDIVQMYSMKSGVRRILESCNISIPPGAFDVCSIDQLHVTLAMLVTKHIHISRWLFKMNDHFDGRGTAYCDVLLHLTCYQQVLKEQEKYGENWSNQWAYDESYNKVLKEIPSILKTAVPVDKSVYATWKNFVESFLVQGGVIEAYPPSQSITGITANVLIEPDGTILLLSVADQFHSCSPLKCYGYTLPQSSIDHNAIKEATHKIVEACKLKGIVGYISIDFVTFMNNAQFQDLWPVGLKIGYTSSHAMFNLISYFTGGQLENNNFVVTVKKSIPPRVYTSLRKKANGLHDKKSERCFRHFVFSSNLYHSNLNHLQYGVFFQICKARNIGYNEKRKLGTVFALFDKHRRDSIGMITSGDTMQQSVSSFLSNLSSIHQDISSTNMQGLTNFQDAIDDLRSIFREMEINQEMIKADNSIVISSS